MKPKKTTVVVQAPKEDPQVVVLKKIHLVLGAIGAVIVAIVTPAVTVTLAFSNAKAEVVAQMNEKVDSIQKENVEKFARKEDMKDIAGKVDQVLVSVSKVEGYIFAETVKRGVKNGP